MYTRRLIFSTYPTPYPLPLVLTVPERQCGVKSLEVPKSMDLRGTLTRTFHVNEEKGEGNLSRVVNEVHYDNHVGSTRWKRWSPFVHRLQSFPNGIGGDPVHDPSSSVYWVCSRWPQEILFVYTFDFCFSLAESVFHLKSPSTLYVQFLYIVTRTDLSS